MVSRTEPTAVMHGLTISRPVYVKSRTRIGKQITVNPTETDENYTVEMLSATDVLQYRITFNSMRWTRRRDLLRNG
jgi:hypothetical protein